MKRSKMRTISKYAELEGVVPEVGVPSPRQGSLTDAGWRPRGILRPHYLDCARWITAFSYHYYNEPPLLLLAPSQLLPTGERFLKKLACQIPLIGTGRPDNHLNFSTYPLHRTKKTGFGVWRKIFSAIHPRRKRLTPRWP